MYTGRLEVTLENIYSVLLATHLLHMPGALEQCRAALLRLRGPAPPPPLPQTTTPSSTILRPVANRLVGSSVCWPQSSLYSSGTVGFPLLPALQLPPRIPVLQNSPGTIHETSTTYRSVGFIIINFIILIVHFYFIFLESTLQSRHHQRIHQIGLKSTVKDQTVQ